MAEHSRAIRRTLRELAGRAHEAELRRELQSLAVQFDQWKTGALDSFALSDLIHEFQNGPARELFNRYTGGMLELTVAHAIARGIVPRDEVAPEVLAALSRQLAFYESADDPSARSN